jgi:hypothetical protein
MDQFILSRRQDGRYEVFRRNADAGEYERCRHPGGTVVRIFATDYDAGMWIDSGAPPGPDVLVEKVDC